jgi:uncharacterized UBP type Zn finger protein
MGEIDREAGLNKESIERLSAMGFERSKVVNALRLHSGNEESALEHLLS